MTRKLLSLAVASAIVGAAGFAPAPAFAQNAEIEALKAQLAALSAKIDQLEKAQTQTKKTVEETQASADKTADVVAQEKARLSFAGDLRYRNESFDVEHVDRDRNRDRIRARLNATFRANDTVTGVLGIATGGPDPRSSNQTLTDQNSRKDFELDLGYVQWAPNADWRFTGGQAALSLAAHRRLVLRRRRQSRKALRSTTPRAISSRPPGTTGWRSARCRSATRPPARTRIRSCSAARSVIALRSRTAPASRLPPRTSTSTACRAGTRSSAAAPSATPR